MPASGTHDCTPNFLGATTGIENMLLSNPEHHPGPQVRQGLRPQFPRNTPAAYAELADLGRACWSADPLAALFQPGAPEGLKA
jgi:hypothetical protein